MPACCFASAGRWECIVCQTGAEAILGFTRQNRDAHASFRIRGMGYCRIPSLQGTRGVKTVETTEQWCCLLGGPTSWLRTPYSSNDWPVRLFPRPPFPLPPVCELLFRGVSSPACPLRSRCTPQPPEIPSRPFHPIYARETVWSGKRKDPPPKLPVPRILGGQVNATPVFEDHKMCRRSRIPMSIANTGGHPHPSRRNNSKRSNTAFRPFLDVIKL